jgi:hypothetical protein
MNRKKAANKPSGTAAKNPVAKHARNFNKASVHKDRKKELKRGYERFKSDLNAADSGEA